MADPDTRVYGMADSSNHQSGADNGLRGEGAADRGPPAYQRLVNADDDQLVIVEEVSGVAYAEAVTPQRRGGAREAHPPSTLPWVLLALVMGYAVGRFRRADRPEPAPAPAALTRLPGEQGGFSQVRDAGPEEIRDAQPRWSEVDEASDESFPASDPPSFSMPGR